MRLRTSGIQISTTFNSTCVIMLTLSCKTVQNLVDCSHYFLYLRVDARSYGNVARFISHSCEPNLSLQQVVVEEDEEKYFHLAFFSVREISPQEVSQNHSFCSSRLTSDTGTYD
mmetsp:Transcript_30280/g.78348  ORF Transcript_30280/g.78348 Transcript_30280/m.78348 type:complete len:114 (-) Transcript_30280:2517-2858(-)